MPVRHSMFGGSATAVAAAILAAGAAAQEIGPLTREGSVSMGVEACTKGGGCSYEQGYVTMDMNWRWLHNKDAYNNCLKDAWDEELCPDPETCSKNCALEGVDEKGYSDTYQAIPVEQNGLKLKFPKAPRVYMLDADKTYKLFQLLNREFTFDVDLSTLPCGMNAALYFVEMSKDGDKGALNPAGSEYGTGYCDAQCPHMKFIQGKANSEDWKKHSAKTPDGKKVMVGPEGRYGICCAEMDILEANREAGAYTAHPCQYEKTHVCEGKEDCGDKDEGYVGACDKDGCGFNPYRMGDKNFWGVGPDYAVDTSKPMTVVTQFITSDNTDTGDLVEIRRFYVQDGKVIKNSKADLLKGGGDSITDGLCDQAFETFNATGKHSDGDPKPQNGFKKLGGLKSMGEALGRGMALAMSIWDDDFGRMLWLDGEKGKWDEDEKDVGVQRGPCPFDYGDDKDMQAYGEKHGDIEVTFSNIKYGEIGSTYSGAVAAATAEFEVIADAPEAVAPHRMPFSAFAGAGLFAAAVAAVAAVVGRARTARGRSAELLPADASDAADASADAVE